MIRPASNRPGVARSTLPRTLPVAGLRVPLRTRTVTAAGRHWRLLTVDPSAEEALIDATLFGDGNNPYFCQLWPAAKAMADELASAGRLDGNTVLELGCGLGLAGMVAASLGGQTTLADVVPGALTVAAFNAAENGVEVTVRRMDMTCPPSSETFDLVLASDLLYEPWQEAALTQALDALIGAGGSAWVSDPMRRAADGFPDRMRAAGFSVEERRRVATLDKRTYRVRIFVIRRGRA